MLLFVGGCVLVLLDLGSFIKKIEMQEPNILASSREHQYYMSNGYRMENMV